MKKKIDKLKVYKSKRNLKGSKEPTGKSQSKKLKHPVFVIQKHKSRNLHYDFRIEVDGVLKSWAIPKGPSLNPSVKRLAMPTDDHPLNYATFEGVIPKGHYGAGTVMVWDIGTYKNMDKKYSMKKCYKDGKIKINIFGQRIKGEYVLLRTGLKSGGWLLIKMVDEHASARRNPIATQNKSVLSGCTMTEINKDK